ncbi:MAG TPA: hypothetical protein G4O03_08790 [Dehalococcoidia bacterium]|nr:hypothetical protein [Dehalococcoidia bacterium]
MTKHVWKSIKFDHFEEERLPSGTTLIHCFFKDNFGNTYRWTPRWKEIEEILFKSSAVEGKNEPEGIWDEELKRLADRILYKQHDIEVFEKSDSIMSEKELRALLYRLDAGGRYHDSESLKLAEFLHFFNYESNQYISSKLRDLADKMCNALGELGKFMWASDAFFDIGKGGMNKLYPAFEIIERRGLSEEKYRKQFKEYQDELQKLVETASQAYRDYRVHVRETLFR